MEVQFENELQNKLDEFARQSGRPAGELVQDAVAGYLDELGGTNSMLDSRYDDIKSGKVKLIPGEEVFAKLREKSEARRAKAGS
jgi:hypothetical protein